MILRSRLTPLDKVKVVIFNFETGHTGYADGLAFSRKLPGKAVPSTRNIFTAVENDYPSFQRPPDDGSSLVPWAERGVLLLNLSQTARAHEACSHLRLGWGSFARKIIQIIACTSPGVVFLVWGHPAKSYVSWIPAPRHLVLRCAHPTPLSAYYGFFDCGHFSRANAWLVDRYGPEAEINWSLAPGTSTVSWPKDDPKQALGTNEEREAGAVTTDGLNRGRETFHLFTHLPPELRRAIYIMATPSRIVHVQEWPRPDMGAVDNFRDCLHETLPHNLHIPSSLDHFESYWLPMVPEDPRLETKQKTLDDYGFTNPSQESSRRAKSTQWRRIDPLWLSEQPDLAWNICRRSELYSKAPIPPLLHTCRESRDVLRKFGYTLAFATRSAAPRTWFHFEGDSLYIDREDWFHDYENRRHDPSMLTLQFMPADLQRVKNLCLSFRASADADDSYHVRHILRFIPRVQTLYCVNRMLDLAAQRPWLGYGTNIKKKLAQTPQSPSASGQRDMWTMIEVDIADFEAESLSWTRVYSPTPPAISDYWMSHNGENFPKSKDLLQHVVGAFDQRLQTLNDGDGGTWSVPRVEIVNVGTPRLMAELICSRRDYWNVE